MNPSTSPFLVFGLAAVTILLATLALPSPAQAQSAGLSQVNFCLSPFTAKRQGSSCTFDDDCRGTLVCFEAQCVPPQYADAYAWRSYDRRGEQAHQPQPPAEFRGADPLTDDGGADEACGQDRRCRIERLAARNRARRHYDIARQERATQREVERILSQQGSTLLRDVKPWSVAFQRHPHGLGLMGGRTFAGHFRLEASWVFQDRRIDYVPDDSTAPTLNAFQTAGFGTVHFTFLPSKRWLSPMVSAGFAMGRGTYGSGSGPQVLYHLVTGAIGAEAQFEIGLMVRMAYRHGRVLYNQVRHGPGSYEADTRRSLREYMNNDGLGGVDFSIGWAF